MDDFELIKEFMEVYQQDLAQRNSDDYELNQPQVKKFLEAYRFFADSAKEHDGRIDPIRLAPAEEHGGITVYSPIYYYAGDRVETFAKILQYASAVYIDANLDGEVCLSMTIPNVFRKK